MNKVVCDARVMRLLLEDRLQDLPALALVGECLIRLGRGDGERQGMKYRSLGVFRKLPLQRPHFLLERLGVGVIVLAVLFVNLTQRIDISFFAR